MLALLGQMGLEDPGKLQLLLSTLVRRSPETRCNPQPEERHTSRCTRKVIALQRSIGRINILLELRSLLVEGKHMMKRSRKFPRTRLACVGISRSRKLPGNPLRSVGLVRDSSSGPERWSHYNTAMRQHSSQPCHDR